jgi:hypothetical protein
MLQSLFAVMCDGNKIRGRDRLPELQGGINFLVPQVQYGINGFDGPGGAEGMTGE